MKITGAQLARLQTLCSQMGSGVAGFDGSRECRLAWASSVLGCVVESFGKLTLDQARKLIDAAQGELGHRAPSKAEPKPRRTREEGRRHGVDGRKGSKEFEAMPELASVDDLGTLQDYAERLGMAPAAFDAWLASKSSPLRGRKIVRTKADANKVRWALKGMLKERGLWAEWSEG